ncbi:MAG: hypothetical protein EA428_13545 [Spirochaetaceae bacterium]|nr:MAG: hypothetical protein EA428_13545 [Spirochaetaceae bacterium]
MLLLLSFFLIGAPLQLTAGEPVPEIDPELDIEPLVEQQDDVVVEYVPIPVLGRTPELGWMFGMALFIVVQSNPETPASTIAFNGIYTTTGAYALSIAPQFYLFEDFVNLRANAAWRSIPSDYYGIGREQREPRFEERYVEEVRELTLNPMFRVSPQGRLGPVLRIATVAADEPESKQRGMESRLLADEVPGANTSSVVEFGAALSWDSREPLLDPYYGQSLELLGTVSNLGASYDYTRFDLQATHIQPLALPLPDHRLALHGVYQFIDGTAPFQVLPQLGGEAVLRGLAQGRYKDYHMAAFQAEYRFPLILRLGAVLFGGVGQTAPNADSFTADEWVLAGGAGLRFAVSTAQRLNIRIDVGYSDDDGVNFYIGAMEAF